MEYYLSATVTYYKKARYEITKGTIHYLNEQSKYIRVVNSFNQREETEIIHNID